MVSFYIADMSMSLKTTHSDATLSNYITTTLPLVIQDVGKLTNSYLEITGGQVSPSSPETTLTDVQSVKPRRTNLEPKSRYNPIRLRPAYGKLLPWILSPTSSNPVTPILCSSSSTVSVKPSSSPPVENPSLPKKPHNYTWTTSGDARVSLVKLYLTAAPSLHPKL